MKAIHLILPFFLAGFLFACSEDDGDNNNSVQQGYLTAHSWTSVKVLNGGNDVTSAVSQVTINFNTNGTFTATGFSNATGTWSLSGSTLDAGSAGIWTVLTLTASSLKIKDSSNFVEIHFE